MIRFLLVLSLLLFLCLYAYGQNNEYGIAPINIDAQDMKLDDLLDEVSRQSQYDFSYNPKTIDGDQLVSITIQGASHERALDILCEELNISYKIVKGQVVLNTRKKEKVEKEEAFFTLSGYLSDSENGESLIGATLLIQGSTAGTVANAYGFYSINLPKGKHVLQFGYIGYESQTLDFFMDSNRKLDVKLKTTSLELPNVIVDLSKKIQIGKESGVAELRPKEFLNMPEFAGESGLVKNIQSLPGMKMHSDGSSFFYVRGGERDQNVIIIDDAPIYNPSHLLGLYSIVIPDFTKSIKVYKSDIPTSLGDRLSSIVSIRTKDGNLNKREFSGSINPLINRFSFESPLKKERGSIFASFRRSNFEWLFRDNENLEKLEFGDFNLKLNYKINNRNRFYFTFISSSDEFSNRFGASEGFLSNTVVSSPAETITRNSAGAKWGNLASTIRWNHVVNDRLFSNTTLYTGNYLFRANFAVADWQSGIGTISLKSDFTHYTNPNTRQQFGLEAQRFYISPGVVSENENLNLFPNIENNYSSKMALYYQGEFKLNPKLTFKAGLRSISWANHGPITYYDFNEQFEASDTIAVGDEIYHRYFNLDPRFSLNYQIDSTSQLTFSLGQYHQYLQLILNSASPFYASDFWLSSSPNIEPQAAQQLALDYSKFFPGSRLIFSASTYFKSYQNQVEYEPHAILLLNPQIEGELRFGSMYSYGLELELKKEIGKVSGWLNYTFSRTLRKTPGFNNNEVYPAFQDRPHDFSMFVNYKYNSRLNISAYLTHFSGTTFSSPTGFYRYNGRNIPIFDKINNSRLPAYQRFDVALQYRLNRNTKRSFEHSISFSIYNVLAHKNVTAIYFNKISEDGEALFIKTNLRAPIPFTASQIDLIRFFPSLTYKFKV